MARIFISNPGPEAVHLVEDGNHNTTLGPGTNGSFGTPMTITTVEPVAVEVTELPANAFTEFLRKEPHDQR